VGCAGATTLTSCGGSCPSGYSDTGRTRGNDCFIGVQKYCCDIRNPYNGYRPYAAVGNKEQAVGYDFGADMTVKILSYGYDVAFYGLAIFGLFAVANLAVKGCEKSQVYNKIENESEI